MTKSWALNRRYQRSAADDGQRWFGVIEITAPVVGFITTVSGGPVIEIPAPVVGFIAMDREEVAIKRS